MAGDRFNRRRKVVGAVGTFVTGAVLAVFALSGSSDGILKLLSPPGAGYDSTSIALTTGSGSPVTVTRASTQTCEVTPGVLTSVAADKPCVESGALKVEPAGTNLLLHSDDLANAGAWGPSATISANTWDYGRGQVGDTLTDDDPAVIEGTSQAIATTIGAAYVASCYAQSGTSTEFRITIASIKDCDFAVSTATSRQSCSFTATGTSTTILARVGNTASDVGSVKVGGCQLETGSVATSYVPTGAATASRAAQTTTVATPSALSTTEGAAKVCVTPAWTGANPFGAIAFLWGNAATTARIATTGSGLSNFQAYDGTNTASVAAGYVAGVRQCYRTSWSASRSELKVENLSTGASGTAAFTAFPSFDATFAIGSTQSGTNSPAAKLDSVCLSQSPDGCR